MEYANLTAIEIAESIRAKKMTCVEITQYYLSQIEKYKDKNNKKVKCELFANSINDILSDFFITLQPEIRN